MLNNVFLARQASAADFVMLLLRSFLFFLTIAWSKEILETTRPISTKFLWNRRHAFLLGTRIPQRMAGWERDWARLGALTTQTSCLRCLKINLGELWSTNSGVYCDGLATIYAPNERNRRNAFDSWDSHSTMDRRNRWMDLRQIHTEDMFGPSFGRVWTSRTKVKGQGQQGQKRAVDSQHPRGVDGMERPRCR